MAEELKGEFTIEAEEGLKALKELGDRLKELGYEVEVPLKKKFADHLLLMEDVRKVWGNINKLPKEYQKAYTEMVEDLKEKGAIQLSTMEKMVKGISEAAGSIVTETKKTLLKGLEDIVPPELRYLGIWGLLIGASLFALEKFKTAGAVILEDWMRMTSGLVSVSRKDLGEFATRVGEVARGLQAEFFGIISDEEVTRILSNLSILTRGFSDFGLKTQRDLKEIAAGLIDLEVVFGVAFGTLSKKASDVALLLSPVGRLDSAGRVIVSFREDMHKLGEVAKGVGVDFGMLYSIFSDVGTKAGEFGLSTQALVDIVGTFATQSKLAGMSLLEYKKGVTELIPSIVNLADPFKIIFMTSALGGIVSPERALYEFERMKALGPAAFGREGGPDFEKVLFRGLAGVMERVDIRAGMRPEEIARRLEVLGMPANLRVFLSDLAAHTGDVVSFLKDAAEGRAPIMTKEIRKDIDEIKKVMKIEEPVWLRLLKASIAIIIDILSLIASLIGNIAMYVAAVAKEGIWQEGPLKRLAGESIRETIGTMTPIIVSHFKAAEEALVQLPGASGLASFVKLLTEMSEEATREKVPTKKELEERLRGKTVEEIREEFKKSRGEMTGVGSVSTYVVTPEGIKVPVIIPYEAFKDVEKLMHREKEGLSE